MPANAALEFACKTDVGQVRTQNEDAYAFNPRLGFAVLADGMGGYNAGEVASSIAVSVIAGRLETGLRRMRLWSPNTVAQRRQLLDEAIQQANREVLQAAMTREDCAGMGTTVVAAIFGQGRASVAHVGDSRLYRYRAGVLAQLTRDHSSVQEQIDAGLLDEESAFLSAERNLLTRAVGVQAPLEVEIHDHDLQPEDIYLLCSDGLSDMLPNAEISSFMASAATLDELCEMLVEAANASGGHDNISVMLIRAGSSMADDGSLLGRLRQKIGVSSPR